MFLACHIPPIRTEKFKQWIDTINRTEGGYEKFSRGYESFGLHALPNGDVRYREWAPNAVTASLTGDFSERHYFSSVLRSSLTPGGCRVAARAHADGWDREKNKMTKNDFGVWEVVVKATKKGELAIPHNSKIKVRLGRTRAGSRSYCGGGG